LVDLEIGRSGDWLIWRLVDLEIVDLEIVDLEIVDLVIC